MSEVKQGPGKFHGLTYEYEGWFTLIDLAFELGWSCPECECVEDVTIKYTDAELDEAENEAVLWLEDNGMKFTNMDEGI